MQNATVHSLLDQLYTIGKQPEGGVYRPVYSAAWKEAHELVKGWMSDAELAVRADAVGNIFGRIDGSADGPVVATGSHIDTVRNGGRLDGALGVVSGLLAVAALKRDGGTPRLPLEVVAFCEEEGSRFPLNFWGSLSLIGESTTAQAEANIDDAEISLAAAMAAQGYDANAVTSAKRNDVGYFVELHVEQGAVLEQAEQAIGIVTAITGISHLAVRVHGRADHAGTTPMRMRYDAMAAAAAMISAVELTARGFGDPAVATVGKVDVHPSMVNVTPDRVTFTVDLRHAERDAQVALREALKKEFRKIADEREVGIEVMLVDDHPPVPMTDEVIGAVEGAAIAAGVRHCRMPSGAGHDAQIMARCCKVGMIFVPSIGGRSHTPEERTEPQALEHGVLVLTETLRRLAY